MPTAKQQPSKTSQNNTVTGNVRRFLEESPENTWRATDVADELGISKAHATAVMARMVKDGELSRVKYGVYGEHRNAQPLDTVWSEIATVEPDRILVRRSDGTLWVAAPAVIDAAGL